MVLSLVRAHFYPFVPLASLRFSGTLRLPQVFWERTRARMMARRQVLQVSELVWLREQELQYRIVVIVAAAEAETLQL